MKICSIKKHHITTNNKNNLNKAQCNYNSAHLKQDRSLFCKHQALLVALSVALCRTTVALLPETAREPPDSLSQRDLL